MHQVSLEEAQTQLPDLIDAAVGGEEIIIAKDPQHLVKLVPVPTTKTAPTVWQCQGIDNHVG